MRLFRSTMMLLLFVILVVAVQQTLLFFGILGRNSESQVKELEDDDQEIALIEPATNFEDWGRLVTAVRLLEADWRRVNPDLPMLHIFMNDAFPRLTADVSEIAFSFEGHRPKLFVRWYKITGEHDAASWVRKLHARSRQPLAIVGGGTSDRAVRLSQALQSIYPDPTQPSPAFLITTATAEKTADDLPVIGVYERRTFRFSFTNQIMVASLLQFVEQTPNLWQHKPAAPVPLAKPYTLHTVSWMDERYSKDMALNFEREFKNRFPLGRYSHEGDITSAIGEFFQPAPQEQVVVDTFLSRESPIAANAILVVPTTTVRMRRFLIHLHLRSPRDARNLVILNGDAISFHAVFRDRDVMWNILDLPYSLLFFAHRDPIDPAAGFDWTRQDRARDHTFPQRTTTGTHDVLLYRDLIEAILYATFEQGALLGDAREVRDRLRAACWYTPPIEHVKEDRARVCHPRAPGGNQRPFFDAVGNRQIHTGEHIVWVRPKFTGDRVDLTSNIEVWTIRPDAGAWQLVQATEVGYNQPR